MAKTKTGIFIDYDNLFFSLREMYGIVPTEKINHESLIDMILETFKNDHIMICNAYADFQVITNLARETNTMYELQARRINIKHVFGSLAKNENRKNASDIELSIDVMETLYTRPEIERYVIISADSDMIPIMNRLKYADKEIVLYYLNIACSQNGTLLNYADKNIPIEKVMDLSQLSISETDITKKYLYPVLQKIVKIDKNNKANGGINYIGNAWFKNQLQSKNFIQIGGEAVSFSGTNATLLVDFLINKGYIINIVEDKLNKLVPNYDNPTIKKLLDEEI